MALQIAAELLSYLRHPDVLTVNGNRQVCNAPIGVLSAQLRAQMGQDKAELMELLKPAEAFGTAHSILEENEDHVLKSGNCWLSFGQQSLWYLDQQDRCIRDWIDTQSAATPDAIAVLCEGREIAYGESSRRSNLLQGPSTTESERCARL